MATPTAICNCAQPDSCIHSVELIPNKGKSVTYKQNGTLPDIHLLDKDGNGAPLDIIMTAKPDGCISLNPNCPNGVLWHDEKFNFSQEIKPGSNTLKLPYRQSLPIPALGIAGEYSILDLLNDVIFADGFQVPSTTYSLIATNCEGKEQIPRIFADQSYILGNQFATSNRITVYPELSWKLNLQFEVGAWNKTTRHGTEQRKAAQAAYNAEQGFNSHSGYTIHAPSSTVSSSFKLSGCNELVIAGDKKTTTLKLLEREYNEYRNKAKTFRNIEKTVSVANQLQKLAKVSGKLVTFAIKYPTISLEGEGKLKYDNDNTAPYFDNSLTVGCTPLIGFEITFNFVEALKKAYPPINAALTAAASQRESVKEGNAGVYAEVRLDLTFKGELNTRFKLCSRDKNHGYQFSPEGSSEAKLTIELKMVAEAGFKVWVVQGVFQAVAKIAAGGAITIKQNTSTQKIEAILHHSGVKAEVYVTTKFEKDSGESSKKVGDESSFGKKPGSKLLKTAEKKPTTIDTTDMERLGVWVIYAELKEDDSTCRFTLF